MPCLPGFARGDGVIHRKQEEDQQEVVGNLNLLTNMAAAALLCHGIRSTSRKL